MDESLVPRDPQNPGEKQQEAEESDDLAPEEAACGETPDLPGKHAPQRDQPSVDRSCLLTTPGQHRRTHVILLRMFRAASRSLHRTPLRRLPAEGSRRPTT